MNAFRQNTIGQCSVRGHFVLRHQVDDAPRADPARRATASASTRPRPDRNTSPAAPAAARETPAAGTAPRAPGRSPPGCRRWRESRSAARSNQPASVERHGDASAAPLPSRTARSRCAAAVPSAHELGHDPADDRLDLIDLAPEIGLGHRERVHHLTPDVGRVPVVVFQQIVEIEERSQAALDDERRQPLGAAAPRGCRRRTSPVRS